MEGADRNRLIAVVGLVAVAVPLVVIAATGGGESEQKRQAPELRVERSNQLPEVLIYIEREAANRPGRAGGQDSVTVECLDAGGAVLAAQDERWPMTQTDGNTLAPHAHVPIDPAAIGDVASCRLSGTDPVLKAPVG